LRSFDSPKFLECLIIWDGGSITYSIRPKKSRYEIRAYQTFSTATEFVENTCNIYIFKYYESILNDLSNDTNHVL
jgi:hypothetical protein